MRHLNYHHLRYFWATARTGSIAAASSELHLTPQTISGQIKALEDEIGQSLFARTGRRLVMTDTGRLVFSYADEIFAKGAELARVVRGRQAPTGMALSVGVVSSMPKLIAERVMAPALQVDEHAHIRCEEGSLEDLLARLAVHKLDLILSDRPLPRGLGLRAFNHTLGESGLCVFATAALAERYGGNFPSMLDGAPMLLPNQGSALRQHIDDWLEQESVAARVVGEFDDSALLKAFGEAGAGVFAGPSVIAPEICRMYGTVVIGEMAGIAERYYAISPERQIRHAAVSAITETARHDLFGD